MVSSSVMISSADLGYRIYEALLFRRWFFPDLVPELLDTRPVFEDLWLCDELCNFFGGLLRDGLRFLGEMLSEPLGTLVVARSIVLRFLAS